MLRYEQETIITFNAEEQTADIYTADPVRIRKLDRLCEEFPDIYKLLKQDDVSKTYVVDKKYITFRKPRIMTKEQREELKQRWSK